MLFERFDLFVLHSSPITIYNSFKAKDVSNEYFDKILNVIYFIQKKRRNLFNLLNFKLLKKMSP